MSAQPDIGLWSHQLNGKQFRQRPAVFLDRDGVLVEEVHFLCRPQDVKLVDGVPAALAALNAANIPAVVVTNQSGIARGHFSWEDFESVQEEIYSQLGRSSASIDLVLACAYHPDGKGDLARDHEWRKPRAGMLLEAANLLGVDLGHSFVVGDRLTDLRAGQAAGLPAGSLVRTGYGANELLSHGDLIDEMSRDVRFRLSVHDTAALAIGEWLATATA